VSEGVDGGRGPDPDDATPRGGQVRLVPPLPHGCRASPGLQRDGLGGRRRRRALSLWVATTPGEGGLMPPFWARRGSELIPVHLHKHALLIPVEDDDLERHVPPTYLGQLPPERIGSFSPQLLVLDPSSCMRRQRAMACMVCNRYFEHYKWLEREQILLLPAISRHRSNRSPNLRSSHIRATRWLRGQQAWIS
jgi:hypothetical protein